MYIRKIFIYLLYFLSCYCNILFLAPHLTCNTRSNIFTAHVELFSRIEAGVACADSGKYDRLLLLLMVKCVFSFFARRI